MQPTYSLKKLFLTVVIPSVTLWTILFLYGYPLASMDDMFFTGAPINLAKGGEFTNPYIEEWNSAFSSGKFFFQPPFYSFVLAGWLKLVGISTNSLLLFQYLCNITLSLGAALVLRFYGFPRITAICTTIIFATWFCNFNPSNTTGFRHDTLGMAFLAVGLWLLTRDNWWRYLIGFIFIGGAVFTSPITAGYGFSLGGSILAINFLEQWNKKNYNYQYWLIRALTLLGASVLIFTLFLVCINFDLKSFWTDFSLHASMRRAPINEAINVFLFLSTRAYGLILILPSYILFIFMLGVAFTKRYTIPIQLKILLFGLIGGIILSILLYSAAIWYPFYFSWIGIVAIVSQISLPKRNKVIFSILTIYIFLCSQSLNLLSVVAREVVPESRYREVRKIVLANPNQKYAFDEVAARFVFDYKFPKNSTTWAFMQVLGAPPIPPILEKDKRPEVTWIVAPPKLLLLGQIFPELLKEDYPRIEFLGRRFNSLPKSPFDVTWFPKDTKK